MAQLGDFPSAVSEYQATLGLNPANVKAKVELAAVLLSVGREPQALQQLEETLRLDPTNHKALELKGEIRSW